MRRWTLNLGCNSNIKEYEIGEDYIDVVFGDNSLYRYSYMSAGREKVEVMKNLARQGSGLNSYIMRHAKQNYEKKSRR